VAVREPLMMLPAPCVHATLIAASEPGARPVLIALSPKGRLFVDGSAVAEDVLSIATTPTGDFFLTTTRAHTQEIRSVRRLTEGPLESRPVEAGGVLIAALSGARVVCEMPRGNLEVTVPRALLLAAVRTDLDAGRYAEVPTSSYRPLVDRVLTEWGGPV
jgi:hypothetical protein